MPEAVVTATSFAYYSEGTPEHAEGEYIVAHTGETVNPPQEFFDRGVAVGVIAPAGKTAPVSDSDTAAKKTSAKE